MSCLNSTYCVLTKVYPYDGEYNFGGTYNSEDYFTDGSYYIYFSTIESRWCLSSSLGGACLQFGALNPGTTCPDLDESFFSVGACPVTTTTTTSPCDVFDFEALFDCIIPTTTTTTTTIPPTTTTTTTVFNPCLTGDIITTIVSYTTTTTTVTPTTTTTTTVNRPCNFEGTAQFNIFDQYMRCNNSKAFQDCATGFYYYSSEVVLTPGGLSPIEQYVYKADVNGISTCIIFVGLVDNISGIDEISIVTEIGPENEGGCLSCVPDPLPTTTTTSTSTTTTTTLAPCVLNQYLVSTNSPIPLKFTTTDCLGKTISGSVDVKHPIYVCSTTIPVLAVPGVGEVTATGVICL